jgi:hypothetical protein
MNEDDLRAPLSTSLSGLSPALTAGENDKKDVADGFGIPKEHAPTEIPNVHYDKELYDEIISAPLPQIYSMLFGANTAFLRGFLHDVEKVHGQVHFFSISRCLMPFRHIRYKS